VTVGRGAARSGVTQATLAFQAADRFGDFVDGFTGRRFGAGHPVDDFAGDVGGAGVAEGAPKRLISAGDRVVDGTGDSAGRG
jgi:hypothetical protein